MELLSGLRSLWPLKFMIKMVVIVTKSICGLLALSSSSCSMLSTLSVTIQLSRPQPLLDARKEMQRTDQIGQELQLQSGRPEDKSQRHVNLQPRHRRPIQKDAGSWSKEEDKILRYSRARCIQEIFQGGSRRLEDPVQQEPQHRLPDQEKQKSHRSQTRPLNPAQHPHIPENQLYRQFQIREDFHRGQACPVQVSHRFRVINSQILCRCSRNRRDTVSKILPHQVVPDIAEQLCVETKRGQHCQWCSSSEAQRVPGDRRFEEDGSSVWNRDFDIRAQALKYVLRLPELYPQDPGIQLTL